MNAIISCSSWIVFDENHGPEEKKWKYENFSKYVKIMDQKFQIQKYKVIMGYKYLCEILHGPEVPNSEI